MFIVNYSFRLEFWLLFKGAVHPNKDILLLFAHPHADAKSDCKHYWFLTAMQVANQNH